MSVRSVPLAWWFVTLGWAMLIFGLSSQPDVSQGGGNDLPLGLYKLAHLLVFGVLGGLIARATSSSGWRRHAWWTFVLVVLYAITDEIHQAFVPGRSPLLTDVAIDAVGGLCGLAISDAASGRRRVRLWAHWWPSLTSASWHRPRPELDNSRGSAFPGSRTPPPDEDAVGS